MNDKNLLAYSPNGLDLGKYAGWQTLLFTTSRACNLSCDGCWTSSTNGTIARQARSGAGWLYDGTYGINVLDAILDKFYDEQGKLVACMSEGEPLVGANYPFISELMKSTGKRKLPALLFTNGVYLDRDKIAEIYGENEQVSYCISMQTGLRDRYAGVMLTDRQANGNEKRTFDTLVNNFDVWRDYDKSILDRTGKRGIALKSYIIPGKTTERDLEALRQVSIELGNVPWIVTTIGMHVSDSLKGKISEQDEETARLVRKYNTGPSATVSFGRTENERLCSYISNGSYPFESPAGPFGITFNPFEQGQIQTCPYHSLIGTKEWFSLRDYLYAMKESSQGVTDNKVREWFDAAVKAETMVTRGAFDLAGYEHCLMRHSRKPRIDLFIAEVNTEMVERRKEGALDIRDEKYFDNVLKNLEQAINSASRKVQIQ
ncbi:MAG: radical SAM protein [Candidatus Aenigmarchaeota archaeon]|nr:radical SAM protein [Candidatus Aenigmarchaeota archaeon]